MRKPLAFASEHEIISAFDKEFDKRVEKAKEEKAKLDSEAEKIQKELEEYKLAEWDKIEIYLKEKGLLPEEYNEDDFILCLKDGVVFMEDKESVEKRFKKKIMKEMISSVLE